MIIQLYNGTTHLIRVKNILNASGSTPTTITSVKAYLRKDSDETVIEEVTLTEDPLASGEYVGNIGPNNMQSTIKYALDIEVISHGAYLTKRSRFSGSYLELESA